MNNTRKLVFLSLKEGFIEGLKVSLKVIIIMIPISFAVAVLNYFNVLTPVSNAISPYCGFLGIRGSSVLALLTGMLVNCYSAAAIMVNLPLGIKEITILSVMILICHNLPLEMSIQKKTGGPVILIFFIRFFSAIIAGMFLNLIIKDTNEINIVQSFASDTTVSVTFIEMLKNWLFQNTAIIKIIIIMIALMIFYKFLQHFKITNFIERVFQYFMFIFGLSKESAFMWIVTNITGLIAGSGILLDYKKHHIVDDLELKRINLSIAPCHALLQETSIFLVLGPALLLLVIPRIIISIATVWSYNFYLYLSRIVIIAKKNET